MSSRRGCAEIAAEAFNSRCSWAQRALDRMPHGEERRAEADRANDRLAPWLAIAAMAGAELPELYEAETQVLRFFPGGRVETHYVRSRIHSSEIADRTEALAELARARDTALDRPQGADLCYLARSLGAPPYNSNAAYAAGQERAA